ncbi:single stranded DNA-binding domain-containing protein [Trueperella bialowiezensis]|uniref:OB-fold nucleic acid binding domain n=1 Tax=Trueperella bialowiezensis TaxID=312285 RepID=A0A3S4Z454_9ACTO|nr:OB-fold nucleic acid binding domain-containing protein [Trueperella bialowiezensis]VEI12508.1 Uncharacterised protein [Trueperella bialowiezensis]
MREKSVLTGAVRAITYPGVGTPARLHIRLQTARGIISLIFLSRETIECIDIGSQLTVTGTLTTHRAIPTMFNPSYVVEDSHEQQQ